MAQDGGEHLRRRKFVAPDDADRNRGPEPGDPDAAAGPDPAERLERNGRPGLLRTDFDARGAGRSDDLDLLEIMRAARTGGATCPPDDPSISEPFPLFWKWFTMGKYSNGEQRLLPELKIECGLGVYNLTLLDHEGLQRAGCPIMTFAELFPMLERLMGAGRAGWAGFKSYRKKAKGPKPGQ